MFESLKTLWKKSKPRCRIMINSPVSWRKRSPDWKANYSASPIIATCKNIDVDLQPGIIGICQK